jgi:prophage antirepressor-like protein
MTQSLIPFSFENQSVRTLVINDSPWFVAADVCAVLELKNVTMTLRQLDDDEQALSSIEGLSRGNETANIISESGLYALILRSRKPKAKVFRKWVTSEVLPAIRQTGAYLHAPAMRPSLTREQLLEISLRVDRMIPSWLISDDKKHLWVYNHLRVAFQSARVQDIPEEHYPAVLALIDSKKESCSRMIEFYFELKDWFVKECLGAGAPWTPSIKKKLSSQLKRQVILPPKVDWLALADKTKQRPKKGTPQ